MKSLLIASATLLTASLGLSQTIFSDDFEAGNMNLWTTTGTSPLTIDSAHNVVPAGGTFSAYLNTSIDRMHHNIIGDNGGTELGGAAIFTSYWYDDTASTATRWFNEVRGYSGGTGLPNGGTTASGSLGQLLAIGKYNNVTMTGEVFNGSKYQARITAGTSTGWFNLDAAGSPNRSTGWHKFAIERLADNTTINFYVDDILSRTITGATAESWDTVVLGPGLGSTVGDSWADGISLTIVPEPSVAALALLGSVGVFLARRRCN